MNDFYGTPVYQLDSGKNIEEHVVIITSRENGFERVRQALEQNKLVLVKSATFKSAAFLFEKLVNTYGLNDSYDIQMQYAVHLMEDRESIKDKAVTVNKRGPFQIIQHHAEGDSSSQIDLFGLHCVMNASSGGENILSLINQTADHSKLQAREKVIIGSNLSETDIHELKKGHLDAKEVVESCSSISRVLKETEKGRVAVRPTSLRKSKSAINGQELITYWDNVTVHDHAFHRHQYELLRHLGIVHDDMGDSHEFYMHIENDSDWSPVNTDSGNVEQTASLFECHIMYKMECDDFLLFNNRAWTHSVNNWQPGQDRKLSAMYA